MSWNIPRSALASVIRQQLPAMVTNARDNGANVSEKHLVEIAGQTMWDVLQGVDDDALVDLQFHGSDTPNQDARVFFISITTKRIKEKPDAPMVIPQVPWAPKVLPQSPDTTETTESIGTTEKTPST